MLRLRGAPAFSDFRLQKFLSAVQEQVPRVAHLSAEFVHFVDPERRLNDSELELLKRLLDNDPVRSEVTFGGWSAGLRGISSPGRTGRWTRWS